MKVKDGKGITLPKWKRKLIDSMNYLIKKIITN